MCRRAAARQGRQVPRSHADEEQPSPLSARVPPPHLVDLQGPFAADEGRQSPKRTRHPAMPPEERAARVLQNAAVFSNLGNGKRSERRVLLCAKHPQRPPRPARRVRDYGTRTPEASSVAFASIATLHPQEVGIRSALNVHVKRRNGHESPPFPLHSMCVGLFSLSLGVSRRRAATPLGAAWRRQGTPASATKCGTANPSAPTPTGSPHRPQRTVESKRCEITRPPGCPK